MAPAAVGRAVRFNGAVRARPGFRLSQAGPCHGWVQTFQVRIKMLEDAQRFASWSTFAIIEPTNVWFLRSHNATAAHVQAIESK